MIPSGITPLAGEGGIHTVVRKYAKYFPDHDMKLVDTNATTFDVLAVHAGMTNEYESGPSVAHLHGLYWTADYPPENWQFKANRDVINAIRQSDITTVPSPWVAKTIERDMRFSPIILPHGIDMDEWENNGEHDGYVLWNKNRSADVCDPKYVKLLAERFPEIDFLTTFAPPNSPSNVIVTGLVPHIKMQDMIKNSMVYLATTKETFGVGTLEAMASGVPVLGFNQGGTGDIITHGGSGYLARPDNLEELCDGLSYCIRNRSALGDAGKKDAANYSWGEVIEKVKSSYESAIEVHSKPSDVTVVIPCFNKSDTLRRAVSSVYSQTGMMTRKVEVIVVNNNSTDNFNDVAKSLKKDYPNIRIENEDRQGVAHARNLGIYSASTKYICCLDADDEIAPNFLSTCAEELDSDKTLGLAYTRLSAVSPDGNSSISAWPNTYDYDEFIKRHNQVPTCSVFRRDLALRLGGYKQRYAPKGAGSEDAEFYLRMGSIGFGGKLASERAMFRYHIGGATSQPGYSETDWLMWHPWTRDGRHPFASVATPQLMSHKVIQYDKPSVSVIIPVGNGHQHHILSVLDSLESQTFRRWEAIVYLDCVEDEDTRRARIAYPYVTWVTSDKKSIGAGAARNIGASYAKASLLLFLDVDDFLLPDSLSQMVSAYNESGDIIYGDYLGRAIIEDPSEVSKANSTGALISYNDDTKEAVIKYTAAEYDCQRAQEQPKFNNGKFYIWCLICSLVPKIWHNEINGFDENMESWEDWDYWIRMAKRGRCFTRIPRPLAQYRFYTGNRRVLASPTESGDNGRLLSQSLLQYMTEKYIGEENMPCSGCGGRRSSSPPPTPIPASTLNQGMPIDMSGLVLVELTDGNIGDHNIVINRTSYGYRRDGDRFLVNSDHVGIVPYLRVINEDAEEKEVVTISTSIPDIIVTPEPVVKIIEEHDIKEVIPEISELSGVRGLNDERIDILKENNVTTINALLSLSQSKLAKMLSCTTRSANQILRSAKSN